MESFLDTLPARFHDVPYDGERFPGAPGVDGIVGRANCQRYAYEVLRQLGWSIPPLRSSELWEDETATARVDGEPQPYDLMLFGATDNSFGAHVGVFVGPEGVLHLCAELGRPAVWPLEEFSRRRRYRHVWVKRPLLRVDQLSS